MDEKIRIARWKALVEDFRRFGGIAENVIQRKGELGLGLFPIDPSQQIELRVPDHLLVKTDNLKLLDGAVVLKNDRSYPKGFGEWYADFQAHYSWGAEARNSIKRFEDGLKSLSDPLQKTLQNLGLINIQQRFCGINEEQNLFQRFIATRQINRNGQLFLMPMIELVNHSPMQSSWIMDEGSIAIQGQYDEEILVRYSVDDPLRRCLQYGFNCKELMGFSLRTQLIHYDQKIIVDGGINFEPMKPCRSSVQNESIIFYKPLLSSFKSPRIPRTLFRKACRIHNGINPDELFDQIHSINRLLLVGLTRKLQGENNIIAKQLTSACLDQISILSEHLGSK